MHTTYVYVIVDVDVYLYVSYKWLLCCFLAVRPLPPVAKKPPAVPSNYITTL